MEHNKQSKAMSEKGIPRKEISNILKTENPKKGISSVVLLWSALAEDSKTRIVKPSIQPSPATARDGETSVVLLFAEIIGLGIASFSTTPMCSTAWSLVNHPGGQY